MWARVAVGLVLLFAGAAKLRDRPPDVPAVLPWVELVLGALLVTQVGGRWTAVPALGLLVAFLVVVVRRVRAGDETPCACFGQASKPVTRRTVARNAVLVVLALAGVVVR